MERFKEHFSLKENLVFILSYMVGIITLSIYGVMVSPFLERLGFFTLVQEMFIPVLLGCLFRIAAFEFLQYKEDIKENEYVHQSKMLTIFFFVDLFIWMSIGAYLFFFHFYLYQAPFESSLKIFVGSILIGLFSGAYSLFRVENHFIQKDIQEVKSKEESNLYQSLGMRFMLLVAMLLIASSLVVFLLTYKRFLWLGEGGGQLSKLHLEADFLYLIQEVVYVILFMCFISAIILFQFRKNLSLILQSYRNYLQSIEEGNLDFIVHKYGKDEFSVVADLIHHLISNIKEKEKIKQTFGKYINPEVAQEILNGDVLKLEGTRVHAAVMFTDIRNYSAISAKMEACKFLPILNDYFSLLVRAIRESHGSLDKFIGDATMSVFGLQDEKSATKHAIQAALEIQRQLKRFNKKLSSYAMPSLTTGMGIDCGEVIAGNIGSQERLEYTVIGGSVNMASHLESLCKVYEKDLLISENVYSTLSLEFKKLFHSLGERELKGKEKPMVIYGNIENWIS